MCSINNSRDSFQRFNDDLCEVLLRYLSITQCFQYQCVSKQFNYIIINRTLNTHQKLVLTFNNREEIIRNMIIPRPTQIQDNPQHIRPSQVNHAMLEKLVKHLPNVTSVVIKLCITEDTINIISSWCKNLKHLKLQTNVYNNLISITDVCWQTLGNNSLTNLESLYIEGRVIRNLLRLTPNLKTIAFDSNAEDLAFEHQNWPQLENVYIDVTRSPILNRFADEFGAQLKSLRVTIQDGMSHETVSILTSFENLEHLSVWFKTHNEPYFTDSLKLIDSKCKKIKVLEIRGIESPFLELSGGIFESLEELTINMATNRVINPTIRHAGFLAEAVSVLNPPLPINECENISLLKNHHNLKHLTITYASIDEQNFRDIHTYLPQLESIGIESCDFGDNQHNKYEILQHLSRAPNLYELKISTRDLNTDHITTDDIMSFMSICPTIRRITTTSRTVDRNFLNNYLIVDTNRKIQLNAFSKFDNAIGAIMTDCGPRVRWTRLAF